MEDKIRTYWPNNRPLTEAIISAYKWAKEKKSTNANANAAVVYIENVLPNRYYAPQTQAGFHEADKTQITYVWSNLIYWRGEEARAAKKIIAQFCKR